jgi:hypothetical protein
LDDHFIQLQVYQPSLTSFNDCLIGTLHRHDFKDIAFIKKRCVGALQGREMCPHFMTVQRTPTTALLLLVIVVIVSALVIVVVVVVVIVFCRLFGGDTEHAQRVFDGGPFGSASALVRVLAGHFRATVGRAGFYNDAPWLHGCHR